jgi:hypothetical protein
MNNNQKTFVPMTRKLAIGDVFENRQGRRGLVVDIAYHSGGTGHGPHDYYPSYAEVFYQPLSGDSIEGQIGAGVAYDGNRTLYLSINMSHSKSIEFAPKQCDAVVYLRTTSPMEVCEEVSR